MSHHLPPSTAFDVARRPRRLQLAFQRRVLRPLERMMNRARIANAGPAMEADVAPFYEALGTSHKAAWGRVNEVLGTLGRSADPRTTSVHYAAFAALEQSGFRPKNVLEFGTAVGDTTSFLARLFPDATITTVDLPTDDPAYVIELAEAEARHKDRKDANLNHPNIKPVRMNSMFALDADFPRFDLIWVDAAHRYPEVAWDHYFAFHNVTPGGWVFSDDVQPMMHKGRKRQTASQAEEVLAFFNDRYPGQVELLLKLQDPEKYVLSPKHIGAYRKPADDAGKS